MLPYTPGTKAWTFFIDGRPVRISVNDTRYKEVQQAVVDNNEARVRELVTGSTGAEARSEMRRIINDTIGNITFCSDGNEEFNVYWNGAVPLPGCLARKLIALYNTKHRNREAFEKSLKHFNKFIENILANPSERSRNELFQFLDYKQLAITERGTFIAYKGIRSDMYSCTGNRNTRVISGKVDSSGHILNEIGAVISVVPSDVDNNRERHCSYGLHVGSWDYASGFGAVTVAVEVNPKDVVSVPSDCQCQKCRVSSYRVLNICERDIKSPSAEVDEDFNVCAEDEDGEWSDEEVEEGHEEAEVDKLFNGDDNYQVYNAINDYLVDHDGEATVRELVDLFSDEYSVSCHEMMSGLLSLGFYVDVNLENIGKSTVR